MHNFPINGRKIRLGLVGCGRVSKNHLDAIVNNAADIDLVAVCDLNRAAAEGIATQYGAKPFTSIEAMVATSELDLVSIATPNGLHAEQSIYCMRHNLHVVTEKPMAITNADGEAMLAEAILRKVFLFVIHQNRYNEPVQLLHKAILEKRFGNVYMLCSNIFWHRGQDYYDKDAKWHGSKDIDGGAFFTQASHYVDILHWFAKSKVKSVFGLVKTLARNIETEDTGSAIIEWENGTVGSINLTLLSYRTNYEGSITVIGENGTAKIGGIALNKILSWDFEDHMPYDEGILDANYETNSVYGHGHILYYKNIVEALRGTATPLVPAQEGLESLKIISAIYQSSSNNRPLRIN